ncbi:hypothetical protein CEXT_494791 [Caerostris extrusa]|uniref:Uncharacterized protein n=1 Tax=Caerostris extrusa TaxID=172846 RepID=A0AAV4P142_CAEEX|nr:hypothetical protein CEXT_494791 [Caerostris extrusa]
MSSLCTQVHYIRGTHNSRETIAYGLREQWPWLNGKNHITRSYAIGNKSLPEKVAIMLLEITPGRNHLDYAIGNKSLPEITLLDLMLLIINLPEIRLPFAIGNNSIPEITILDLMLLVTNPYQKSHY